MRKTHLLGMALAGLLVLTAGPVSGSPVQSNASEVETYSWSAELVTVDEGSRTMTVSARVVGPQAPADLKRFKAGERIVLTWSGYDRFADAIRGAAPFGSGRKLADRFQFPAEFVSFDADRNYTSFKVPIPQSGVNALKPLKPGEWVTATSPHGLEKGTDPILSVRPYTQPASSSSTN